MWGSFYAAACAGVAFVLPRYVGAVDAARPVVPG